MIQATGEDELFLKIHRDEEEHIARVLAEKLNLPYLDLEFVKPDPEAVRLILEERARALNVVGVKRAGADLTVGALNPRKPEVAALIAELDRAGHRTELAVVSPTSLKRAWEEYRFLQTKHVRYAEVLEVNADRLKAISEQLHVLSDIATLVERASHDEPFALLEYFLAGAMKFEASDVHLEPGDQIVEAKYRIDGILYAVGTFPLEAFRVVKNRIKVAAQLLLNVTAKPQDGRFSILVGQKQLEIRVSTLPSAYEETVVMRVLDAAKILVGVEQLGLRDDHQKILEQVIKLPNGLLLNTGPTGSGKTTTLYAILNKLKRPAISIITIEDPIEYHLAGINQTQIDPRRGYTFATGLRSILRQDPDVVLVGEIRDRETAEIAIHASLTGHLVISTLHTNDALGAIPRLVDLKVDRALIPPSLRLIIAQRLVRKLCPSCRKVSNVAAILRKKIQAIINELPSTVSKPSAGKEPIIYEAVGCSACGTTGYHGRIGVFELLPVTPALEQVIYGDPTEEHLRAAAQTIGYTTMLQDAALKVANGTTTIAELERVLGPLT